MARNEWLLHQITPTVDKKFRKQECAQVEFRSMEIDEDLAQEIGPPDTVYPAYWDSVSKWVISHDPIQCSVAKPSLKGVVSAFASECLAGDQTIDEIGEPTVTICKKPYV